MPAKPYCAAAAYEMNLRPPEKAATLYADLAFPARKESYSP